MGTDNDQNQNETAGTKSGLASDDKAKAAAFTGGHEGGGRNETAAPVTTNQRAERGGSAIDDRSKDFEVIDHPKA